MRLSEVRRAMGRYATRFDPALVAARDAATIVEDAAAIKNMAATVEALAAARVAEAGAWKASGDRSPAHELARRTGTTVGKARETLETGRKLQELHSTADAAKRGALSPEQASAITDAAGADPHAEQQLLETAESGSLRELRDECARTKAKACDREERRRRIHERRQLRTWVDADGAAHLHLLDNPEKAAAAADPDRNRYTSSAGPRRFGWSGGGGGTPPRSGTGSAARSGGPAGRERLAPPASRCGGDPHRRPHRRVDHGKADADWAAARTMAPGRPRPGAKPRAARRAASRGSAWAPAPSDSGPAAAATTVSTRTGVPSAAVRSRPWSSTTATTGRGRTPPCSTYSIGCAHTTMG